MILVFGKTGQVARELDRYSDTLCLGRDQADFTTPAALARLEDSAVAAVIIAAAYTAVDSAEADEPLARTINATTPGAIARACAARGVPLVYISTDYVFDGSGTAPWTPADSPAPINAYGRSKLAGEQAVRAAGGPHAILRTSWVVSATGTNFVKTMLRLGAARDRLNVVADQIGGPTCAGDIAAACLAIAAQLRQDPGKSGCYHFSGGPDVSWADFACAIFARAGLHCAVEDIASSAYPTTARRPLNSRLDNSLTTTEFGIERPDWRLGLGQILQALEPPRG